MKSKKKKKKNESKLAVKKGSMSKKVVAKKRTPLTKKERIALLQSQPQDSRSSGSESSMSSVDGMRGINAGVIPRTPDKDKVSLPDTLVFD